MMTDRPIHIPTVEEIASNDSYGILFSEDSRLRYFDLCSKKAYKYQTKYLVKCISATHDDVYILGEMIDGWRIASLFSEIEHRRGLNVYTVSSYEGRIVEVGRKGLLDTLEEKVILPPSEIISKEAYSLTTDDRDRLYMLSSRKGRICLLPIRKNSVGRPILNYGLSHSHSCNAEIFNWGSLDGKDGRKYNFSVLSCCNLFHLDINGDEIAATEEEGPTIRAVKCLRILDDQMDVIYSGYELQRIMRIRIDLHKRRVTEREILLDGLSNYVFNLEVVKNYNLHRRLIEKGNELYAGGSGQ